MNGEIVIDIGPDGTVTVEGREFVGAECKELTRQLEADLGTVTRVKEKPEFNERRAATRAAGRVR